jgi:hypothetical protein
MFNTAAYLVRHICVTREWIEGLASLEWNIVTSALTAVNRQDRAKDKLCVRLTSTWFSQDVCLGV